MNDTSPTALNEAVCFSLYSAMHATLQLYRDLLAPWGLTYQQLLVLALVWEREDVTPGQLADTLFLDSSSVTGLLNRMERAELIERAFDPTDRRRVRVTASPRGLAIRSQLGWLADCLTRAISLDPDDAADLVARLHRLRATVSGFPRPDIPPPPPALALTGAPINNQGV